MKISSRLVAVVSCGGLLALTPAPAFAAGAACGDVITTAGATVTLDTNLSCGSGPGLTVAADGVTIDLAGHRIVGTTGPYGIQVEGSDVTVTGGRVVGFVEGIAAKSATSLTIDGMVIVGSAASGIHLDSGGPITVGKVSMRSGGYAPGLYADHVDGLAVSGLKVTGWGADGARLAAVGSWSVASSRFTDNRDTGLNVRGSTGVGSIQGVRAARNGAGGITVADVSGPGTGDLVAITGSVASGNVNAGIAVVRATRVVVDGSTASHNTGDGIAVEDSHGGVTVRHSRATANGQSGFAVGGSDAVTVELNRAASNGINGFSFQDGVVFSKANVANHNGAAGLSWLPEDTVGSSTSDTAVSNHYEGMLVSNGPGTVTVTSFTARLNGTAGMRVAGGNVVVSSGRYVSNSGDGVSVEAPATAAISGITTRANLYEGVGFWFGSGGSVSHIRAIGNGDYGLLISAASAASGSVTDLGGNTYSGNASGDVCPSC